MSSVFLYIGSYLIRTYFSPFILEPITNQTATSHRWLIANLLGTAEEAYIAVAFLKQSGFNLIKPYIKTMTFEIVAGFNFDITDPAALSDLHGLSKKNAGLKAYLIRLDYRKVFHPKITWSNHYQIKITLIIQNTNSLGQLWLPYYRNCIRNDVERSDDLRYTYVDLINLFEFCPG